MPAYDGAMRTEPQTTESLCIALGDVIEVQTWWGSHPGVVVGFTALGEPVLAHCSRRRGVVCEEPLRAFADGRPVKHRVLSRALPVDEVIARARAARGRRWHLLHFNCEHFVGHALGLEPRSPQIRAWTGALGVAAGVAVIGLAARLRRP